MQLSYQYVSKPKDIYDLRPKFETGESTVKVVNEKSVTQWQTQNITESQTVLTTARTLEDGTPALQGAFGGSVDSTRSARSRSRPATTWRFMPSFNRPAATRP